MRGRSKGRWSHALRRLAMAWLAMAMVLVPVARGEDPTRHTPNGRDDQTFRPTVIVRKGNSQGSGTIIASVDGETLVLTAAHVVQSPGVLQVEVHRYNMGVERALRPEGWPIRLPAETAASDTVGDVAVVRVRGRQALPFVARLAPPGSRLTRGSVVTSVGIDGGEKLDSWPARVLEVAWFGMATEVVTSGGRSFRVADVRPRQDDLGNVERPFFITSRAPREGRSGGGLYLEGDRLVGVCVGRIEKPGTRSQGVFASCDTIHHLLHEHDLGEVVARSEARHQRHGSARAPR